MSPFLTGFFVLGFNSFISANYCIINVKNNWSKCVSNVISFPSKSKNDIDSDIAENKSNKNNKIRDVVFDYCASRDLDSRTSQIVFEEFYKVYESAFESFTVSMKIPRSIGLDEDQIVVVSEAHRDAVNEIYEIHSSKMTALCKELLINIAGKYINVS